MSDRLAAHGGTPVLDDSIKVKWPIITQDDKDAVMRVLDSGVIWGLYAPEMRALEAEFAAYCGAKYCLAMNSGTAALHCAIGAAGIGPGDEVITSAYSFLASGSAVLHHNAIPIFVDIDPRTHNIDVGQIEAAISPRTKAILPVHIHGLPADMDEVNAIAAKHGLLVIEDACQAHGATYKGKRVGTLAAMATFSLNGTKGLSGGEGGLLVTDSEEYRGKANMLRMFGEFVAPDEGRKYQSYTMGWNYRTQEMPCAFTRSQLRRLDDTNATAQRNAEYLSAELAKIPGLAPPYVPEDRTCIYHKYRLGLEPEKLGSKVTGVAFRNKLQKALQAEGVDAVLWQLTSLPEQPVFQILEGYGQGCPWSCEKLGGVKYEYRAEDFPVTKHMLDSSVVICSETYPIYAQPVEVMERYVEAFHKVFGNIEQVLEVAADEVGEQVAGITVEE